MGRINAHTHIYSGLVPLGMPAPQPPPESFVQILERIWWRLDRALDEDSLRSSAELYVAESLGLGTVGLVDHHESPSLIDGSLDVIADVCEELGMPAVICYGATERNGGAEEGQRGLAECRRFIEHNQRTMVRGMVGLHAAFTVSDDCIREAAELARELGVGLHLHVAEGEADVVDARRRGYEGVVDRLAKNGAMVERSIFAHGVHLGEDEVRQCRDAGIWLVQNPRSNQGNGVGYPANLRCSDRVGLGTDGYPADMSAEYEALVGAAREAGDDAAAGRLDGSTALFAELWGGPGQVPAARPAPDQDKVAAIRARAEKRARDLWQRMQSI